MKFLVNRVLACKLGHMEYVRGKEIYMETVIRSKSHNAYVFGRVVYNNIPDNYAWFTIAEIDSDGWLM